MIDASLLRCLQSTNKRHTWIPVQWIKKAEMSEVSIILCTSCFNTLSLLDSLEKLRQQTGDTFV